MLSPLLWQFPINSILNCSRAASTNTLAHHTSAIMHASLPDVNPSKAWGSRQQRTGRAIKKKLMPSLLHWSCQRLVRFAPRAVTARFRKYRATSPLGKLFQWFEMKPKRGAFRLPRSIVFVLMHVPNEGVLRFFSSNSPTFCLPGTRFVITTALPRFQSARAAERERLLRESTEITRVLNGIAEVITTWRDTKICSANNYKIVKCQAARYV